MAVILFPAVLVLTTAARVSTLGRSSSVVRAPSPSLSVTGPLSGAMPERFVLPQGRSVILFDGVCNFCNRWVGFVLDNDPEGLFCFASLQSEKGRELLQQCGRSADDLSTFVVIDKDGFWTQSTAALRVGATLKQPALNVMASTFMMVPPFVRDRAYRVVATNRYSILGKASDDEAPSCTLRRDAALVADRFL
jgi:predicted DCC family thiol-disulfide oxidoreductase YuxK